MRQLKAAYSRRNRKIANTKPTATIEILYEGDWEEIDTQ